MTLSPRSLAAVAACAAGATFSSLALAGAAAGRVTISANHTVMEDGVPLLLRGSVSSGRAGEPVTVEQDDCGPVSWHPLRTVQTGAGGGWVSYADANTNIRLRARWRSAVSRVIAVGARPELTLAGAPGSLRVLIRAYDWFDRKTVELQRLEGTRWRTVATARLAKRGAAGQYAQTSGAFMKKVGHGLYRAVLPSAAARPCYVAGFSGSLRL